MPSLQMRLARAFVRSMRGHTRSGAELQREYANRKPPVPARVGYALRRVAEVREDRVAGRPVFTATPKSRSSGWHIVYTHGGAFVNPLHPAHWNIVAELVQRTGASVSVPIYPLAPEHHHAEAFAFLEQVYRSVLERLTPSRVLFCGDSAGGNLALAQAFRYRELGLALPAQVVLFAPWLDLTLSNPAAAEVERDDVMLRCTELVEWGRWWSGATDPRAPLLSPLFGDLAELPPVRIFQGTHDLFWPDTQLLRDKLDAHGGQCVLHEAPGAFHVYMAATFTPEAKHVFATLAESLRTSAT